MQSKILFPKSSWIKHLLLSSLLIFVIFILSFILIIINFSYQNTSNFNFLDSISFPIQFILAIYSIMACLYLFLNSASWIYASMQSSGFRKIINFIFSITLTIFVILIFLDSIYKIYLVFINTAGFLSASYETLLKPIFIGWFLPDSISFKFNTIGLFAISFFSILFSLIFYFFQKFKYRDENTENDSYHTKKGYANKFIKSKKKQLKKVKKIDPSEKIKIF